MEAQWVRDLVEDEKLTAIPDRYVRFDQDPIVMADAASLPEIPVIDFEKLNFNSDKDQARTELEKLHGACKDWGFFQLINHGMSPSLVEAIKRGTVELFNMPKVEKAKFVHKSGKMEGFGQAFVESDDQKLDWAEMFNLFMLPKSARKPHLFPKLPLPFRDDLESYSDETKRLAVRLLCLMGKALGMDAKEATELFDDGIQGIRMNYYPPCPQPDLAIGLTSHSDADAVTILLQVNETEGLQIRKDRKWIPVSPLPGAFIVNVGDIIEIISNGMYQSIDHRAAVNALKERVSIATFYSPRMEAVISPAPSLITPEKPALFRRITVAEHLHGYLTRELKGKAYLDAMRIQTE